MEGLCTFWNSEGRKLGIILSLFVLKTAEHTISDHRTLNFSLVFPKWGWDIVRKEYGIRMETGTGEI